MLLEKSCLECGETLGANMPVQRESQSASMMGRESRCYTELVMSLDHLTLQHAFSTTQVKPGPKEAPYDTEIKAAIRSQELSD